MECLQTTGDVAHRMPNKNAAITRIELEAMRRVCDAYFEGLRNYALPYFIFTNGNRRHSEIADVDVAKKPRASICRLLCR